MPELPDIAVYIEALSRRIVGARLEALRLVNPFLLRTFEPPVELGYGRQVSELRRLGKRIAIGLEGDYWLVLHLMIAGRLHWKPLQAKVPARVGLAAFDFSTGTLILTEAGSKRRAGLWFVQGTTAMAGHDPGGIDIRCAELASFIERLKTRNQTLKRALTDPALFSGIGNSYSDEILHRARLSPFAQSQKLDDAECLRLYQACREVLDEWTSRLRAEAGDDFPEKVTAFRKEMAVHGRFGKPCPVCATPVQRIRYADNETNYCPRCQTQGKILADRSLSRLLKDDWPRNVDEL